MQKSNVIIRPIQLDDLHGVMRLSTEQGWNQTEADWRMMIENQENSCLLAEYDHHIVGSTTAINYLNDVAWISMVLVDKEYRGHGISKILLEGIFKKLIHCKSLKLDATPEGQRVYKNYNFMDEYSITRMTCDSIKTISLTNDESDIVPIRETNIPEINELDQFVFGANRIQLIEYLLGVFPRKAWMLKRNQLMTGFAFGRDGRKYSHIGPVIASSTHEAKILISKAVMGSRNKPWVVDVLNDKIELMEWLTDLGFAPQRHFLRMYQNLNPFPGNIGNQFLICGPEFG